MASLAKAICICIVYNSCCVFPFASASCGVFRMILFPLSILPLWFSNFRVQHPKRFADDLVACWFTIANPNPATERWELFLRASIAVNRKGKRLHRRQCASLTATSFSRNIYYKLASGPNATFAITTVSTKPDIAWHTDLLSRV